jgi:hypothetical protein
MTGTALEYWHDVTKSYSVRLLCGNSIQEDNFISRNPFWFAPALLGQATLNPSLLR